MKIRSLNTEELEKAIEDNEILLVDMYAEWCGPCKMLAPVLEDIATKYHPNIKVVKVDIDKFQESAEKYNVRSVPTTLFFYNGKLKQTIVGFQPKARFESIVEPLV